MELAWFASPYGNPMDLDDRARESVTSFSVDLGVDVEIGSSDRVYGSS